MKFKDTLRELNRLVDELSNNNEAWRGPERALIRVLETVLSELCNIADKKRENDEI